MTSIDFWYSIGSTYSYLTVLRLADIQKAQQVQFRWRPFDVRHVMIEQDNLPFNGKPIKTAHMSRDIERREYWHGL